MNIFANKAVTLKGNLKNCHVRLKYVCYPTDEFKIGQWLIAASSVSFIPKESFSFSCTLKSNLVSTSQRSEDGEIKTYLEPLITFQFSATAQKVAVSRFSNNSYNWKVSFMLTLYFLM